MADTSYFDLYKALKADGAVQGDWNSFHRFVGAPGKQGYLNRKKLYDALKADGAVQSSTYEEFNNRLFRGGQASLRAAQQRQQGAQPVKQVAQPQQQPQTAAQRAMQMVGGGTDYMKNWQLLHKRNDQMTPTERMQANTARSRTQQAQKQAYQQEQRQKNANPIYQSKVNPHAQSFNETMQALSSNEAKRARAAQQRQDDATNAAEYEVSGNQFSHDNGTFGAVAPQIDAMVAPSMTEADDLSWKNYQDALKKAGNDAYLRNKAWKDLQDNRIKNRQEVLAKNLGSKLTEIYSDKGMQRHIMESADKLNMGVEEYVDKYVTPQIMNRAQSVLGIKNIEEVMPKSAMEYVVRRLGDSILGTLSAGQDKSKEQIAREQEAMAISDDLQEMPTVKGYNGEDVYHSGVGGRFVSTAANMMMDSPILGMTGGGANLTVDLGKQVLTRGLAKVGLVKAGAQLSAKQLGFKIANMSMAQKVGSGLMEGTAKGALNLGGYSAITSALGQASTGKDTSMAALAEAGLEGFKHGATTGAMFGASGAVMATWISKFGIDGTETTRGQRWLHGAQKVGAEAVGLGAEAGTMMVADNVTGDKDISVGQWLEDVVMVGAFKAGEPSNYGKISQALYHLTHNTSGRYTFGKDSDGKWRTVDIKLTDAEKGELVNSTSGKNLMDAFSKVDKTSLEGKDNIDKNITKLAYKEFMADPTVSQSTKEKVNAAMGLFNTDRKVSQRSVNDVQNKQILEYADDGTILTRTSYKNAEQRRAILFKQKVERADMRMMNLIGYGKLKGRQILDSNDQITPAAASFLNKHGYDLSKEPTDANNAQLIADIKDKGSKLYAEWVKFADEESQKNMLLDKYILDILSKDPMKRTDEEMRSLNVYYKDLKDVLFPEGKPNVEQSTVNGQEVAEENNLGTEQPNNQAVLDNLHGLTEAENEMEQLMNSNDIFSDNFKNLQEQGLTHPQIYDWLIQNGMTEEDLAPYAHYMNAVAKVQGMQNATAQAIEEYVGAMAQDWGFHGKMNGVDADGSQVLYVQDRDGRMLIVGSGEVAYDATDGHAKEGVGDMLVCLDPNTRETVYVRAEDTTLFQAQDVEDFKNEERQRLQSINSVPYNQAAQEQAAAEAAKPQPKEEAQPKETVTDGNQLGQPQQEDGFEQESLDDQMLDDVKPVGKGSFGDIYDQFKGDALGAIKLLLRKKSGEAIGALHHKDVGDIDLVWGKEGTGHSNGFGLAKLAKFHPEVLGNLQEILDSMHVTSRSKNRINLESDTHKAAIRLEWDGKKKNWLLTAFKKENASADGKTTDTSNTSLGGDTALSQTEGSPFDGKDTNNSPNVNGINTTLTFKDGSAAPVDANGEPDFMQMTPEQGVEVYKQLFPKTYETEVDNTVKMLEADLKKVQKATPKAKGLTARAKEQAEIENAVSLAEAQLARAKEIKKAITSEKIGENIAVGTKENVSRYDKEREQGYRMGEGGVRYDRQKKEDVGGIEGKEVEVAFTPTVKVKGHVKLVELDTVQASHNNGQINMMHFGPDWQPKDRASEASKVDAEKIAGNIDPKQITGSDNAFIGSAPSVNERHETIQGNNRVDALKQMYSSHSEQAAKYKQYLIDHAEDFGLKAEDVASMKKPIIVNELPVDDATAKKLGQYSTDDFQSGGKQIPSEISVTNLMGDKLENFASILLGKLDDSDIKLYDIIANNAEKTITWLNRKGYINDTQAETLLKDKALRNKWLGDILKVNLFDGDKVTEQAFNALSNNAQKAVLATFLRDAKSGDGDRIKGNLQNSFEAYNELNQIKEFANAKNLDEARKAIEIEVLNGSNSMYDDVPIREKYTNFELELAALYKGLKDQKTLAGLFNEFYNAVQGSKGRQLEVVFDEKTGEPIEQRTKPISKDEAIEEVFGTNNDLANDRRRETEPSSTGGRGNGTEPEAQGGNGEEQADKLAGVESDENELEKELNKQNGRLRKRKETVDYSRNDLLNLPLPFGKRYGDKLNENEVKEIFFADNNYAKRYGKLFNKTLSTLQKLGIEFKIAFPERYGEELLDAAGMGGGEFVILNPRLWGEEYQSASLKGATFHNGTNTRSHTILHEMIHAVTLYAIHKYELHQYLPEGLRKACEDLHNLTEEVKYKALLGEHYYGLENERELIAELSDPRFCQALRRVGLWTRLVNCIRQFVYPHEVFNRDVKIDDSFKRTNAYDELSRILGDFLQNADRTIFEEKYGRKNVEGRGVSKTTSYGDPEKREAFKEALRDGLPQRDIDNTSYEFSFKDALNESGILDDASVNAMWKKEVEAIKKEIADEAADYIDGKTKEDKIKILPEEDNAPDDPTNPFETIAKAADDFKKEHPMTEEEIMAVDGLDDEAKYTAIDYLNGEDDSEIARICYEQAYAKRTTKSGENVPPSGENRTTSEEKVTTSTTNPMETIEKAAADYESEKSKPEPTAPKTAAEKKAAAKKLKEESDKKTQELMNQFLAAKDEKKDGSGKLYSLPFPVPSKALKWMDRNLTLTDKQKEILPKLLSAIKGSMYARIKEGIYDLEDVIENVRKDFKAFFDALDKDDANKILAEAAYKGRFTDPETGERIRLAEAAERERKLSPEHQEKLVGDSKDAEDRKQKERSFINRIQTALTFGKFKSGIVGLRKIAEDCGLKDIKDTDLQELAETAVVMRARDIAASKATSDEVKFKQIKRLYDNQPSLNQRDSERIEKQQYSTPAPYAFVADMYVKGGKEIGSALEPSAGNGMLTIGLPMDKVHVNDIDEARLLNLQRQGFKNISSQDGTQPFADKDVDVVITNPPFGSATPKDYDGYRISSLEGQMAINALESMKDDGRAAIIIGGKTEYAKNGSLMPKDKAFLGYLYSHYNVEDVINVDGSLYAKQGTSYPTRIILINGRRLDENAFPPVKDKARAETVKDYDELYKRVSDDILRGRGVDSSIRNERRNVEPELDRQGSKDSDAKGVRVRGREGGKPEDSVLPDRLHEESSVSRSDDAVAGGRGTERESEGDLFGGTTGADRAGADAPQSERGATNSNDERISEPRGSGRDNTKLGSDESSISRSGRRLAVNEKEAKRELTSEKVAYTPKSGNPFTLQSVMPADQQEAVNKNLAKLGDADQFLVDELGYNDKDDLYKHLAAEQVDAVALAINQAKQGNAFIIGDMTGIGKGRQAASLIRYAKKQGQIPVYFTQKAILLSDVYRDLVDIGNPELRPFIFGSDKDANVTDSDGNLVYKKPSDKELKRVLDYIDKNGTLPKEYDYVLTTYSQVGNGIYEYAEDGSRKERKLARGKKFDSASFSGQRRRDAIEKLMDNGYLIMDESHTAGGDSGLGNYFQHIIQKAKNVTFFSATFAKRPDNMPIYALRTAMNQGGLKASELIDAVKRGGATLQEIMSQTLTQCGQMIRRERDMTGVTIDWKAIDDPEKVEEQRAQYDSIIGLFNDIINFQRTYVSDYVENRNKELAAVQASMGIKRGAAALGIKNTPFASKAFNTVQQVLLSLKAKSAAERAVEYLKQGMKPVIALSNTNESQTDNIAIGEEMDAPDLGTSLKKGLEGTLRYTQKDAKNNSDSGYIKLSDLGDEAVAAYHELEKKIEQTSTGLSLSPIDVIKNELQKAGYKVGELTGRQTEFVYNDNGTVTKVKRADTDKKKLAREFNDGQIDALILNKSAATGISLHASSKFKDQRKRVMIVAQQQLDVNDEVQMRGRIDRTGQILRGAYEYVVSLIPAEQRLLMMFKAKLKSLDANTTSSQKSKFNEMEVADITNKYGDKVVREYMAEHLDLYARMADPFGWEQAYGDDLAFIDPQKLSTTDSREAGADASKLLGRMALLKVAEQEKMLQEIGDLYAVEINRLNEMGENDLEITELPLKAKTIGKEVWKQGTEPDGDNAFADNTYIEKVNMAILKKPMKAEEVQKAQEGLTGGRSWDEYRDEKKQTVKAYFDEKIADATQKNEERAVKLATHAKEKYLKDAKRGQKDSGMSDEQIEQMAGYQYDNIYKAEKEKLDAVVKNLKAKAETFDRVLDTFNTEDAYVLPADMNNPNEMSAFGNSYGRLIDIKITDNFSPNASSVSFATLDGRRKITFPISGKVGAGENKADVIAAIDRMTKQASGMGDKNLRVLSMDTANWNRLVSNESRKDGYIITGNLMQALIDTKEQGVGGQLVKYTTDTGEVKTGILMPDRFEPKDVSVSAPISSVEGKFHKRLDEGGIESVKSTDGDVEIIQKYNPMKGDFDYQIRVPKSQKRGGKYFLDKELMSMMGGGNFETRGNSMLGEFKEKDLRPVLARLSNLGVKVKEERQAAEEDGTHFREDKPIVRISDDAPVVVKHVDSISRKLGAKVNMIQSAEDVTNKSAKAAIERGEKITGWYDEKTGEVHLYMPNIHDRYTAEKTIWHEVVGHKGMRELFGDENYSKFLRSIWYDLDKPENARLKELVSEELKYNPFDFENGIEEGIARLVEDGKGEPGFWNAIKNKVTDILHEIGYRIAPNTKDVKYLLWLGKNLQKNPNDPYWKMKAEAVRYKLDKENVPVMIEKDGVFYTNDGKARSFNDLTKKEFDEATDGVIHLRTTPSAGTALDRYHKALDAHGYMFTESYMDNMLSLKNLMQAIVPDNKNIADIKSSENPYILQNTMQGAMSNASQMFERNVMKPLDKAMAEVLDAFEGKKDDEKIRNFNLYMITKHGLERNRILYMRDTLADMRKDEKKNKDVDVLEKDWYDELANLDERLNRGDIDLKGYFDGIDDFIRTEVDDKFDAGEHDYSGIHAIQGVEKSSDPYDDAEAIASVMDAEANMESIKKGSVKAYWDKVKMATQFAIDIDYKNGLISRELHGHVSAMFNWYVPLRKYDEATAEDTYGYITEKGDPKNFIGSSIMRARGHKYLSETNVLAQIGAMGNRAINNGGQNAIKQAFARFIRNHSDNNLVTETSVWYVDDPVTKTTKERYPEIPEDATPDEVNQIVADFNREMRDLESKGLATKVHRRGRIGYKFERAENKSQHIVDVMIAGKKHSFIINGNPRAAQALNGLLENWNGGNTKVAKWAVNLNGKIVRFFAQACTSYNPEFVMRNMVKDYEFSTLNLLAKEGGRYTGIFEKYYFGLVPFKGAKSISLSDFKNGNGLGLFAKYRNGMLDMNDKVQRYFKEFMENGGETGFVQMLNMKDWTKKYKTEINANRSNTAKAAKILKEGVFGTIEGLNEVAENMARFATYCASRDCNRTVTRSVYDAKEVTVNFNRHGSGSAITTFKNGEMSDFKAIRKNVYGFTSCYLRHASMFFNAGIQSTNMLLKNAKSAPIATAGIIASAPFALAALMPLANQALMAMLDDDEKDRNAYAELPDYVRRNNLCVYVGGGEFVTVPLAIETRAFYGLGDLAAGLIQNPDERKFGNIASQSVGQIAQLVPIMDYMGTKDFGENPLEASFQAFSPSSAEPLIEWERNKDWKGQEIERRGEFYKNDPAWERANSGTNSLLMNINKFVNAETNDVAKGNEEMLGNNFLDQVTNPSMLEHFGGGITKGMGTFGSKVAGVIKKTWNGEEIETKDKPFIRSFFYTPSETSSMQRTKSKFYNYTEELSQDKANLDKLKSKTTDPMKAIQNASDYMKFIDSPKAQQIRILELADKQIKRIKKMRNKQTDTEVIRMADQQIGLIMQDAVEKMDKLE